jgi:hypothetical protein
MHQAWRLIRLPIPDGGPNADMSPDPDSTIQSPADVSDRPRTLRLQLASVAPPAVVVNGGWWPQSTDLAAELPALLSAVYPQLGPIALVGYHISGWERTESHVEINSSTVLLQGFTSEGPHTVIVIGTSGKRLTLLVVPPQTPETTARQALAEAAQPTAEVAAPIAVKNAEAAEESLHELTQRLRRPARGAGRVVDTAAIERLVHEAGQQFQDAPIQAYVPILIEHIVRQQISANTSAM